MHLLDNILHMIHLYKKILIAVIFLPLVTHAQFDSFENAIRTLSDWIGLLVPFLLALATLFFFWGLTKFILNADQEEARVDARNIMIWGVLAVFVMVSIWGLVAFISNTLGLNNNNANDAVIAAPDTLDSLVPR